jgi:hypothetical protein
LIKRLDLLDTLLASLEGRDPTTAAQITPLRDSLLELLRDHSIEPFTFEAGTKLDVAMRKRIHIVEPTNDPDGATEITRVFRPGYVWRNGPASPPVVLRKAEVRTGRSSARLEGEVPSAR